MSEPVIIADSHRDFQRMRLRQIEHEVAEKVARELVTRLPRSPQEFVPFIERGYELAQKMSWDVVAREYVLPGIQRVFPAVKCCIVGRNPPASLRKRIGQMPGGTEDQQQRCQNDGAGEAFC